MDTSGFPVFPAVFILTAPMATGCILMKAGPGFPIIRGDGRHFTMVAGFMIPGMDGYGFRMTSGDRDGLPGEDPTATMDGLPLVRVSALRLLIAAVIIYPTIDGDL